jgi:hypothetical protein
LQFAKASSAAKQSQQEKIKSAELQQGISNISGFIYAVAS